jgi:hypothetical protein
MLGMFGVIFILAGGATLAVSTTMFGQISGLILWVIAALFIVGQAVVSAIGREVRALGKSLAPRAAASGQPGAPPSAPAEAPAKGLWNRFKKELKS